MDECSGFENRRPEFFPDRGFESPSLRLQLQGNFVIKKAPVAQWIEHQIPDLRVGGSSPLGSTKLLLASFLTTRDSLQPPNINNCSNSNSGKRNNETQLQRLFAMWQLLF